jgi:hypothetical protein
MKKKSTIYIGTLGLATFLLSTAFTIKSEGEPVIGVFCGTPEKSSSGINGRTQSPHDLLTNPNSCEGCHGGGATTPTITLNASPAFGPGNTYVAGTTYTISYKVSGYSKFGFNLEINNGNSSSATAAGTLTAGTSTQIFSNEVLHTSPISSANFATFQWTAPSSGTVYLYSTGLGVNNANGDNGDKQAFYNLVLTPAPLSISETNININEVTLYPNPSKEDAIINFSLSKHSQILINITDLNGKIVSSQMNEEANAGSYSKKLDLSDLNDGTYFVKIKSDDNSVTKKLVIQ